MENHKKIGILYGHTKNMVFWPSLAKSWFFHPKLGFPPKTIMFLGKSWFFGPKPSFSYKKVGFLAQNHLFPRKTFVFPPKTNFFLGKRWFWTGKPIFFLGKTKKHLFGVWPYSIPIFLFLFFLFSLKKLVFPPKTMFFLGKKFGFSGPKPSFS